MDDADRRECDRHSVDILRKQHRKFAGSLSVPVVGPRAYRSFAAPRLFSGGLAPTAMDGGSAANAGRNSAADRHGWRECRKCRTQFAAPHATIVSEAREPVARGDAWNFAAKRS